MSEGRFIALCLGTYALLGIIGGALWRLWWDAPSGMVLGHEWIPGVISSGGSLYPLAGPPQAIPAATAHWALLALAVGVLGGVLVALVGRGREYAALAVALIGSAGAGLLMMGIGYLHRGDDPRVLATGLRDGVVLHDRLALAEPWLLLLPVAATGTVVAVAFLGWAARQPRETTVNVGSDL